MEAELLVLGIPVFNSGGEVIDFKTYNAQATLGIKGPEYRYTLAITELSKKIKAQLGAEAFKSFYQDCLDYEPLIQLFCSTDDRRKLDGYQELKTKNLTESEGQELEGILRLLVKEFTNILGADLFKPSEVKLAVKDVIKFVNYREILAAFAILEKYKEIRLAFSAEELVSLLELVHIFQNAKRYQHLPKAKALSSLHDLPELKDISSLAAINAYIRRDSDGKSDNWIGYCCIDPPEANQSRYIKRQQGHYINTKDIHYLVPSVMSRRFDPEVLNWFAAQHPALHMLQWMHVILERTLQLNQLYDSQVLQDSALAQIMIPEDYIRQELASRKRIREICIEQLRKKSSTLTIHEFLQKVDPVLMRFYDLVAEQNEGKMIAETFRNGIYKGETVEQVFRKKYTDAYVRQVLTDGESSREPFYLELLKIQDPLSYSDELCKRLFDAIPEYEKNFNEGTVDIFEAYKQLLGQLDWEIELTDDEQFQLIVALGNAFDLIQNQKSFNAPHHPFITNIGRLSPERAQQLLFRAAHKVNPNALKFLLKMRIRITNQDEEGRNAFHILCERHGAYPRRELCVGLYISFTSQPRCTRSI